MNKINLKLCEIIEFAYSKFTWLVSNFFLKKHVSLCGTNREWIFRLPKSSWMLVCAVSLLMPNSSAINLSVSHRSCASICRTFSFIYRVLLVDGRHERGSSSSCTSLCDSVWTIPKHIFSSHLPSRTPAPTFHASPLKFSPICSRTWCLHVAPLRYDTNSHTDYVQLAAVGLHCRSHAVHAVCRFSPCLSRTMCMHAHMSQVAVQIWHHSPNFLDTPCLYFHLWW